MHNVNMWEIFIPATYVNGGGLRHNYLLSKHQEWDEKVKQISGGLTVFHETQGIWVNPHNNETIREPMILVRIACNERQIMDIAKITLDHYNEKAVLFYKVSSDVRLVTKDNFVMPNIDFEKETKEMEREYYATYG